MVGAAFAGAAHHVLGHAVAHAHAGRRRLEVDVPGLVDEAGDEELSEQVDEAAAADARGRGVVDGAEGGLPGVVRDVDVLDGAGGGAHAVAHAAALEGGPGRAGARQQPVLVAEHHLAVGADVDEQGELVGGEHARGDHAGGDVAAHVAAHRRHDVHARQHVGVQAELAGEQLGRRGDRGDVGLLAQESRVQAQQQMGHGRVAGDRDLVDLVELDAGCASAARRAGR